MSSTRQPEIPDGAPPVVVAMDGTSGSGKSSTSRGVAARLGLAYLDTGAQFRALTWWMLREGVDVQDADAVAARCAEPAIESGTSPVDPTITVDGTDVSGPIRGPEVTRAVSPVSAVPAARRRLLQLQRSVIERAIAEGPGIVVEGRDIATAVWPDAGVKMYLTADASARAERRTAQDGAGDVSATEADLRRRDQMDSSRAASPLSVADDAVQLDTTGITLEEAVDQVVALVRAVTAS